MASMLDGHSSAAPCAGCKYGCPQLNLDGASIGLAGRLALRCSRGNLNVAAGQSCRSGGMMNKVERDIANLPDTTVSVRVEFGIDSDMTVPACAAGDSYVPELDPDYLFDRQTTLAILAGFAYNRRVMVSGYHGTGKSTHIEQVAARLNWPCVRVNLDSHVSRIDLVGKDAIVVKDG